MPDAPKHGTLDVTDITVGAMLRTGIAVRQAVRGAEPIEEFRKIIDAALAA